MTFSSRRGSEVLSLERKPIVREALKVGERVIVPSLFGYYEATVIALGKDAAAETAGLYFPLWLEGGHWFCDSAINKAGLPK